MTRIARDQADEDLWAKWPLRASEALVCGDLTFDQHGILAFLCAQADYRKHTFIGKLSAIADGLQWRGSDDKLRRDLAALREGGWIDYTVTERQRKPYLIRLKDLLVESHTEATAAPAPRPMRQSLVAPRQSPEVRNPQPKPLRVPSKPPACGSPQEEKRREQTKDLTDDLTERTTEASYASEPPIEKTTDDDRLFALFDESRAERAQREADERRRAFEGGTA